MRQYSKFIQLIAVVLLGLFVFSGEAAHSLSDHEDPCPVCDVPEPATGHEPAVQPQGISPQPVRVMALGRLADEAPVTLRPWSRAPPPLFA